MNILYTTEAVVEGGRAGHGRTSDGRLAVEQSVPKELGGNVRLVRWTYNLLQIAETGKENFMPGTEGKVVIITGASSGIGEAMGALAH